MVHPLVITAAATAGIGAAVAFEVAVFRPWRDENWPEGFGQGVRNEFLKLRREVEQAVHEIQDDLRTLRDQHRRGSGHRRLSDGELDDFRRGVGEEASRESTQHEFEMHEHQASAYRERLRASMNESLATDPIQPQQGLRRRRRTGSGGSEEQLTETTSVRIPVLDVRMPSSPELPHHQLGDASPSIVDVASLPSASRFNSVRVRADPARPSEPSLNETGGQDDAGVAAKNGLLGLEFGSRSAEPQGDVVGPGDPFANIVDGTASSWHAVFADRTGDQPSNDHVDPSLHLSVSSREDATDEGHVVLDTNGLSQTLSDQHLSFHSMRADTPTSVASNPSDSPRLQALGESVASSGARSGRTESEADFEVLSDTTESEGRWSHLHAPPSPTISSGSEPIDVGAVRGIDVFSVTSDGVDSWAELSEPDSDADRSARTANVVRSAQS